MKLRRTDLAVEIKESFPEDNVEIEGVVLTKEDYGNDTIEVTTVEILDDKGSKAMQKPKGVYISMEMEDLSDENKKELTDCFVNQLKRITHDVKNQKILIVGLGNRMMTPDAIGPRVAEHVEVNRHFIREFGDEFTFDHEISALTPGVMGQTGMESLEIIKGVVEQIKPQLIIAVDALAARNIKRLHRTIQITDVGVSPGAGVGNNRNQLNEETLGIPCIGIGVPTVVDAQTIIDDHLAYALTGQGYDENEIEAFLAGFRDQDLKKFFVTGKDVDEEVEVISKVLAEGLNEFLGGIGNV